MRERPIIFSGPMVRAILDGRKTQTRRVIGRTIGSAEDLPDFETRMMLGVLQGRCGSDDIWRSIHHGSERGGRIIRCPYGQPGDRLWVREAFRFHGYDLPDSRMQVGYKADGDYAPPLWRDAPQAEQTVDVGYRSSRHMPRWASRITLEVTGVRVERVQDISEADAVTEGISEPAPSHGKWCDPTTGREAHWSYRRPFSELWDSINGKRGFGWDINPWIWVVEFKRMEN